MHLVVKAQVTFCTTLRGSSEQARVALGPGVPARARLEAFRRTRREPGNRVRARFALHEVRARKLQYCEHARRPTRFLYMDCAVPRNGDVCDRGNTGKDESGGRHSRCLPCTAYIYYISFSSLSVKSSLDFVNFPWVPPTLFRHHVFGRLSLASSYTLCE
jgi:hypothetical protein